jgi:hypothetical protein
MLSIEFLQEIAQRIRMIEDEEEIKEFEEKLKVFQ